MDQDELTQEEQRFLKIINKGIEQVVVPALDSLEKELKKEIKGINIRLDKIEKRLESLEDRLNSLDRKVDIFTAKVTMLEIRVNKLFPN